MSKRRRARPFAEVVAAVPAYTDSMQGKHHSRLLGDELWDEDGRHWQKDRELDNEEVEPFLVKGSPLVLAQYGVSIRRFVPPDQALQTWARLRREDEQRDPADYFQYWPWLFRHGDDRLVLLDGAC